MITQVSIKDLRGIAEGTVSNLTPLTILTGVNGSGKSTVLDALLIASAIDPGEAVGRAVQRRASQESTAQWLFRRLGPIASLAVSYKDHPIEPTLRETKLSWFSKDRALAITALRNDSQATWIGGVDVEARRRAQRDVIVRASTLFDSHDAFEALTAERNTPLALDLGMTRLVDMRGAAHGNAPLTDVLTEADVNDQTESANELLRQVIPGFRALKIMSVGEGFEVGVDAKGGAIPLSMAGDGIRGLARLALELAALPSGLALLEEPEVHQHPGALKQSATTIVAGVKRGLQVVVATHSLELIDELLLAAKKSEMLDQLTVQNLRLAGGVLASTRFEGPESDEIRNVIGTELR